MSLVVDTTKRYRSIPEGENFTFSLSKPFNELTVADLLSADCWVGFNACSINQIAEGAFLGGIPENNPNYCNLWGTDADWWFDQTDWTTVHWSYPANFPTGVYMRNVYVNRELNPGNYTIANATARLVLEITPDADTTIQQLCMVNNENYLRAEYGSGFFDSQMSDYSYISPAMLIIVNDVAFLVNQNVQRFFVPNNIGFFINSSTDQGYSSQFPSFENSNYHKLALGWTMGATSGSIEDNCVKTGTNSAPDYTYSNVDFNGHTGTFKLSGSGIDYHKRLVFSMADNADDSDFSLIHRAYTGVRFRVNDVWYKPIIEDGIVTGYTDDFDVPSEWDTWTKASEHNVPSVPPTPGPTPAPYDDDPWHGVNYGTGGYGASPFCTSYAMTGAELSQLAAWGGKTEEQGGPKAGYDYMPSIISLIELPMEVSGTTPTTVKLSRGTLGGYDSNIVDTGVSGNPVTAGTQRYNLGSVTLPLRMNERGYPFLDWDTVIELYLPFVGMFSLDPYAVLGKTITAFLDLDVLNGTVCGYAYVINNGERLPIAYGSAQVGVSLPVTSDGAASARLALTTANTSLGSSMISGALQLGTLASAGGMSNVRNSNTWAAMNSVRGSGMAAQAARNSFAGGAANALNGYASGSAISGIFNSFMNWGLSLKQLQSSNNTQVNGSMGGGSFSGWSTPNEAYVKIIRPHAAGGAATTAYGKTHAYPYESNATLVECKGLTFAVNPDVSGITKATDAERSQIAELLMGGVIA